VKKLAKLNDYLWLRKLLGFFWKTKEVSGTLTVVGHGSLEFTLDYYPDDVYVFFKEECEPVLHTCDPGCPDILKWKLIDNGCYSKLLIKWHVNTSRTIYWYVR